jgi:hypothetical protein
MSTYASVIRCCLRRRARVQLRDRAIAERVQQQLVHELARQARVVSLELALDVTRVDSDDDDLAAVLLLATARECIAEHARTELGLAVKLRWAELLALVRVLECGVLEWRLEVPVNRGGCPNEAGRGAGGLGRGEHRGPEKANEEVWRNGVGAGKKVRDV